MAEAASQVGETEEIEIEGIIFKREDTNPSGSVKDRGLVHQLRWAKKQGIKDLVISSSGSAAIAAAYFSQRLELNLFIFVSPKINQEKLRAIERYPYKVFVSPRAVSDSLKFARKNNFYHLRPSTDSRGTIGYQEIAKEVFADQGQIDSIFIPVSSGTTLVGIAEGFEETGFLPQTHAVQTTAVNPIARVFDQDFVPSKTSLADALVARYTLRKRQAIGWIRKSKGWGWVVSDQMVRQADEWLKEKGITTSFEGAAALAAIWKARDKNWQLGRKIVCLLTGKKY